MLVVRPTPIAPGTICAEYGCKLVHPAETHDSYIRRYEHSENCEICK